jgi:hypothetical protein
MEAGEGGEGDAEKGVKRVASSPPKDQAEEKKQRENMSEEGDENDGKADSKAMKELKSALKQITTKAEGETSMEKLAEMIKELAERTLKVVELQSGANNRINSAAKKARDEQAKTSKEMTEKLEAMGTKLHLERAKVEQLVEELRGAKGKLEEVKITCQQDSAKVGEQIVSIREDMARTKEEVATAAVQSAAAEVKERTKNLEAHIETEVLRKVEPAVEKARAKDKEETTGQIKQCKEAVKVLEGNIIEVREVGAATKQNMRVVDQLKVTGEQQRMDAKLTSFTLGGNRGVGGNLASLAHTKSQLGQEVAVTGDGRDDTRVLNQLRRNIQVIVMKRHGIALTDTDIEMWGWQGRSDDNVHFKLGSRAQGRQLAEKVNSTWLEGGRDLNGFVNHDLTFERNNLGKILRKARKEKTVEKGFQEWDGQLKYEPRLADRESAIIRERIFTRPNGKKEVFITPHSSNGYRMMSEKDLLEVLHLVTRTGERPENGKDAKNLVAEEGHKRAAN